MRIAIGSDHGGYQLKEALISYLKKNAHNAIDAGPFNDESCDYPDFAGRVVKLILTKRVKMGILICKSGLGMSMAANRYKKIRAALCFNNQMAASARQHNDANILVLGAKYVTESSARQIAGTFIKTKFLGGRHARRVKKLDKI
ncbi:MAG: ribose 5-phosphate isomerase B [Candidatus Omnitrophica bacterium]|nr:ribose 5-phosphate isomerase B [Candidatus Omnitrophota bacterium]